MTHKELVNRAFKWIRDRNMGCTVAMKELKTWNSETPDVIGFWSGGRSMLIECKASRNDFLADKNKHFRREAEMGMGDLRFFLCADEIFIQPNEKYAWVGQMTLFMATTPKFDPKKHIIKP